MAYRQRYSRVAAIPRTRTYAPAPRRVTTRGAPARVYTRKQASAVPAKRSYRRLGVRTAGELLPIAGGLMGSYAGPAGSLVGTALGKVAGKALISGFGDYNINQNSILKGYVPQVSNSSKPGSGTIITFKEYIGDVISSSSANTFAITSHFIRPTSESSFPWLSQLASNYQEWSPHGIVYEFKSSSGNALDSVNTALGSVILCTNYNSDLPAFGSRSECENSEYSNSIKPSESCLHPIECARSASVIGNLYTSDSGGHADIRLSTLGRFQIATAGVQGTSVNLGSLYVSYQIELLKPKLFDALGNDVQFCNWNSTGTTDAAPLGTTPQLEDASTLNIISPTNTVLTFPNSSLLKYYMLQVWWRGTSTASLATPTIVASGGAAIGGKTFLASAGSYTGTAGGGAGSTSITLMYAASITVGAGSSAPLVTFSGDGTLPPGTIDVKITEIPNMVFNNFGTTKDFLTEQ